MWGGGIPFLQPPPQKKKFDFGSQILVHSDRVPFVVYSLSKAGSNAVVTRGTKCRTLAIEGATLFNLSRLHTELDSLD